MEQLLAARDFDDLQNQLREIDAEVPYHPRDRDNSRVETYALVSLLAAIPWPSSCFPLQVFRRERPDFLVRCSSADVGIEHTEGINPNLAKERALRADGNGPGMYFVTAASVHDPVKTKSEILADILADESGDGWCGDSVERNWAEAISHFVQRKVKSAKKDGYVLYGDDRLMIYDSWPAPGLKHQRALPYLREHLEQSEAWSVFRRIYVIDQHTVLELRPDQSIYHRVHR